MEKIFLIIIYILTFSSAFAQKTITVKCDSIYKDKGISLELKFFNESQNSSDEEANCTLIITQNLKDRKAVLLKDSIFSSAKQIEFKDYNNDTVKDILVQNFSDVRSNWTYYLYLFNPKTNRFSKVIGFEEIKNPSYNLKYNIIESHVVSGTNWVGFYKIKNNKIYDYQIEVIDDGSLKAEKEYQKAIRKISLKK